MTRKDELLGAFARSYCDKENSGKVLDPDLGFSVIKEIEMLDEEIKQSEEYKKVQKCLACLPIAVEKDIASDIQTSVNALISKCLC
jgi:hypothetical protein